MPDNLDFTDKYNTDLSSAQEKNFQAWMVQQSKASGRDISKDLYDYDLRGDWLQGASRDARGHGADTFKKPNHITFSTGSKYNGVDGNFGGTWAKAGDSWTFTPGKTNLANYSREDLQDYFGKVEKGNRLIFPTEINPQSRESIGVSGGSR